MATNRWGEESQVGTKEGFAEVIALKGRVVDIFLTDGTKLGAARIKDVRPSLIQVTHKDRIKYLNPDHVVMIELS
jgi:hypothetical protein